MRERTTWNRAVVAAFTAKKAEDPRSMNQDHIQQQPAADAYVIGGPSDFGEGVAPSKWRADEYENGTTKRDEIGMAVMRTDTFNHPEKTAEEKRIVNQNMVKKANLCANIAKGMLGKQASEQAVEDQAFALMFMPDHHLVATADRLLKAAQEQAEEEDEEEKDQEKQAQEQEQQTQSKDEEKKDQEKQAKKGGEVPPQFLENIKEKKDDAKDKDDKKDEKKEKQASQSIESMVQSAVQAALQSMQQQAAQQEQQAQAPQQSPIEAAMQAGDMNAVQSMIQSMVQNAMQGQMGQQQQQRADDQMLDQLLGQQLDGGAPPMMSEADISLDPSMMDIGDETADPSLQVLFAGNQEYRNAAEAHALLNGGQLPQTAPAPRPRVAGVGRRVGTQPSAGVSQIGGTAGAPATGGNEIDRLANMWRSDPDVSGVFGR